MPPISYPSVECTDSRENSLCSWVVFIDRLDIQLWFCGKISIQTWWEHHRVTHTWRFQTETFVQDDTWAGKNPLVSFSLFELIRLEFNKVFCRAARSALSCSGLPQLAEEEDPQDTQSRLSVDQDSTDTSHAIQSKPMAAEWIPKGPCLNWGRPWLWDLTKQKNEIQPKIKKWKCQKVLWG